MKKNAASSRDVIGLGQMYCHLTWNKTPGGQGQGPPEEITNIEQPSRMLCYKWKRLFPQLLGKL